MMIAVGGSLDDGQWNAANNTIYVRKALSAAGRIEVFYHEMHHCVTDMEWAERCVIANRPVSTPVEKQLALPLGGTT
jgi:hypothetical protein